MTASEGPQCQPSKDASKAGRLSGDPGKTSRLGGQIQRPVAGRDSQSRTSRPRARATRNLSSGTGLQAQRMRENSKSPGGRPLPLPTERRASHFKIDYSSSRRAVLFSHLSFLIHFFCGSFGFTTKLRRRYRDFLCTSYPAHPPEVQLAYHQRPHQSGPLVTDEPRLTCHHHPESTV